MAKIKLLLDYLGNIDKKAISILPKAGFQTVRAKREKKNAAERHANLRGMNAVYVRTDDFYSDEVLKNNKDLKLVVFGGTGYQQYIDTSAATKHGIAVLNTPGANAQSVAEFAVGMVLDSVRKFTFYNSNMKAGKKKILITNELGSLKIGLIGHGNINSRIEKILVNGFNVDVKYWDYMNKKSTPLDTILKTSDIVIIAITEIPATRNFIDAAKIKKMKKGAILINPARPNLVEPNALIAALNSGKLSAAAFDGLYDTPIREKFLKFSDEKFVVSPHIAARTSDALLNTDIMAMKEIVQFFKTGKSKYIVNPEYKKTIEYLKKK